MQELLAAVQKLKQTKNRPLIIAISGFGGSGKSTLAKKLLEQLGDSQVVSIDSFSTHEWQRNAEWDNFDRVRFAREVLLPAHANQFPLKYAHEPWPGNPEEKRTVLKTRHLIVEGCSIFHPDLVKYYDFKIWVDCPLEIATKRGMWRDRHFHKNEQDYYWQNIWMPNEKDFHECYRPDLVADFRFNTGVDPIFSNPRLAAIYDAFDPDRSDLLPYLKIVNDLHVNKVIDLGCGTGIFPLLLMEEGMDVVAVDPAAASIDIARLKPHADKIEWIIGDAGSLADMSADIVTMTGNAVQAIIEPEQWGMTLDHVGVALKPGGRFIFETRNPHFPAWNQWNKKDSFRSVLVPEIGRVDGWVELIKADLPLVSFRWTYFFHKDSTTLTSDSTLRFRSLEEITKSLSDHGFEVEEVREAPDRPGKEHVIIARNVSQS